MLMATMTATRRLSAAADGLPVLIELLAELRFTRSREEGGLTSRRVSYAPLQVDLQHEHGEFYFHVDRGGSANTDMSIESTLGTCTQAGTPIIRKYFQCRLPLVARREVKTLYDAS
jgi:hypothetical protein